MVDVAQMEAGTNMLLAHMIFVQKNAAKTSNAKVLQWQVLIPAELQRYLNRYLDVRK